MRVLEACAHEVLIPGYSVAQGMNIVVMQLAAEASACRRRDTGAPFFLNAGHLANLVGVTGGVGDVNDMLAE